MYSNEYAEISNYNMEVVRGNVLNAEPLHIFGLGSNIDTNDGEVDIWDGVGDAIPTRIESFNWITSPITLAISCNLPSSTAIIKIEGLDGEGLQKEEIVELQGNTSITLQGDWSAVNKASNISTEGFRGYFVYIYDEGTAVSGGEPTDTSKVRCIINGMYNQSQSGVYTVPSDRELYICQAFAHLSKQSTSEGIVKIYTKDSVDQVSRLINSVALQTSGTSGNNRPYPVPFKVPAGASLRYTCEVYSSNTAVTAGFQGILIKKGNS